MTPELLKLIDDYGDASFDCGEWQEDDGDLTPYETVFGTQREARQALLQEISRLQAELATIRPGYDEALKIIERQVAWIADKETLASAVVSLKEELEQAKSQQVHCAACGGIECHRLAEIVQLTGVESDQHLVEWVEQAKERERQLRDQNMRVGGDYFRERTRREGLEFVYAQLRAEINDVTCDGHHHILKEENSRLLEALTEAQERNRRSICVYCGEAQTLSDPAKLRDIMAEHIVNCSRHPLNRVVGLLTAIELLIERTEACPHCFDLGAVLAKQVAALTVPPAKEQP